MVYTDGTHLIADNLYELHLFARKINLNHCWFDPNKKHPHYDLYSKSSKRRKEAVEEAIKAGAKLVTAKQIVMINNHINEHHIKMCRTINEMMI